MKKLLLYAITVFVLVSCGDDDATDGGPGHYEMVLDLVSTSSRYEAGQKLGAQIRQGIPGYEGLIDAYLADISSVDGYANVMAGVADLKPGLHQEFKDEIEGMASQFSPGAGNVAGDGRLSPDELYAFNLIADIIKMTPSCAALAVYGSRSSTGSAQAGRVLDWYGGWNQNYLAKLHCVLRIVHPAPRQPVCLVGFAGFLGAITGFNRNGVFGCIIDSPFTPSPTTAGKRSFPFDLRYALENYQFIYEISDYMKNSSRVYVFNHLVFLADATSARVVENDFNTASGDRLVRMESSTLNPDITWGLNNALAAVNSFVLFGNTNNHTGNPGNYMRWNVLRDGVTSASADGTVSPQEFEALMGYDGGNGPGNTANGDIYNYHAPSRWGTLQIILFQPATRNLKIFFCPRDGNLPDDPSFETIQVAL
ncbi:MAG: hypothetical protein KBA61_10695 [Spirochaetes bacterium]|nr:hypothetical protein [Spirochaetota bacterium]